MNRIKIIKKPWGEEHLFALTGSYAGKMLFINKGHQLSLQYHNKKEETLLLLEGTLKLTIGAKPAFLKTKTVKAGYVFHLPPGTVHRMKALIDCKLIEVSTPELDDVVRIADDYERAKM